MRRSEASPRFPVCRGLDRRLAAHSPIESLLPWLLPLLVLAASARGQFLPPGVINPFADVDPGADLFVSHLIAEDGTLHAVWASTNDYPGTGAGADPDILYSYNAGGGWSAPELVNSYGGGDDFSDEQYPRLALTPDGILHCVWQSRYDFAGAGNDWDVLYARRDAGGWGTAELVNPDAVSDNLDPYNQHILPTIAARPDSSVVVVWQADIGTGTGLEWGIRESDGWGTRGISLGSQGVGPAAMHTSDEGTVVAVWSQLALGYGTHYLTGAIFLTSGVWQILGNITSPGAPGDHREPAVVTLGKGGDFEIHIVWATTDPADGNGSDWDLRHLIRRTFTPLYLGPFTVNSTATSDGSAIDLHPSLCVEPGGVVHVVWQSTVDLLSGSDWDVYHADNATPGSGWTPVSYLGLNAPFDAPSEHDLRPDLACSQAHILSGAWDSSDDAGGTVGNDPDIFHALGLGRLYHRPRPVPEWTEVDSGVDQRPRVALHGGVLHVVWESNEPQGNGSDYDLYHRALSANWGPTTMVNTTGALDGEEDKNPDIAVDHQGRVHVVWESQANIGSAGYDSDVFYTVRQSGSWSMPELIDAAGTTDSLPDSRPRIAVDAGDVVHVVWRKGSIPAGLRYARRGPLGWAAPEDPSSGGGPSGDPTEWELAVEESGTPHVVWSATTPSGTDVFYARRSGGSWSTVKQLDSYGGTSADTAPAMGLFADGEVIVVWSSDRDAGSGADADLWVARRTGGVWSTPSLLLASFASDTGDDRSPAVAVGAAGYEVAWSSLDPMGIGTVGTDPDIFHVRIPRAATVPADAFIGVANPNAFADSGVDDEVSVVMAGTGISLLVWTSDDSLGGVHGGDRDVFLGRLGESLPLFADGFESGDTSAWSAQVP